MRRICKGTKGLLPRQKNKSLCIFVHIIVPDTTCSYADDRELPYVLHVLCCKASVPESMIHIAIGRYSNDVICSLHMSLDREARQPITPSRCPFLWEARLLISRFPQQNRIWPATGATQAFWLNFEKIRT